VEHGPSSSLLGPQATGCARGGRPGRRAASRAIVLVGCVRTSPPACRPSRAGCARACAHSSRRPAAVFGHGASTCRRSPPPQVEPHRPRNRRQVARRRAVHRRTGAQPRPRPSSRRVRDVGSRRWVSAQRWPSTAAHRRRARWLGPGPTVRERAGTIDARWGTSSRAMSSGPCAAAARSIRRRSSISRGADELRPTRATRGVASRARRGAAKAGVGADVSARRSRARSRRGAPRRGDGRDRGASGERSRPWRRSGGWRESPRASAPPRTARRCWRDGWRVGPLRGARRALGVDERRRLRARPTQAARPPDQIRRADQRRPSSHFENRCDCAAW